MTGVKGAPVVFPREVNWTRIGGVGDRDFGGRILEENAKMVRRLIWEMPKIKERMGTRRARRGLGL
jgi:hypothetical protein